MIWGYRTRERITFPDDPSPVDVTWLVNFLKGLKTNVSIRVEYTGDARKLLDAIYKSPGTLADPRFESYYNRRFTQLLKLCIICMCSLGRRSVDGLVVRYANTILVHAETFMPKALGEFGLAKNSDVTHKVLGVIYDAPGPVTLKDIWKVVHQDFEKIQQLGDVLMNLKEADKIQSIPNIGFLPKLRLIDESLEKYVDYGMLTEEERNMKV